MTTPFLIKSTTEKFAVFYLNIVDKSILLGAIRVNVWRRGRRSFPDNSGTVKLICRVMRSLLRSDDGGRRSFSSVAVISEDLWNFFVFFGDDVKHFFYYFASFLSAKE